jgi:hypothetical protein
MRGSIFRSLESVQVFVIKYASDLISSRPASEALCHTIK